MFQPGFLDGGPVALTWRSTTNNGAGGASPYTSAAVSFGPADPTRIVVVGIAAAVGGVGNAITAVTIGGIAATRQQRATIAGSTQQLSAEIWTAAVPTGATGTVAVTFSGGGTSFFALSVYSLSGASGQTPSSTAQATATSTNTVSANLTVPTSGAGLGVVFTNGAGVTGEVWTNLTEDTDQNWIATADLSSASTATAGAATRTSTSNVNGSQMLCVAAWGP